MGSSASLSVSGVQDKVTDSALNEAHTVAPHDTFLGDKINEEPCKVQSLNTIDNLVAKSVEMSTTTQGSVTSSTREHHTSPTRIASQVPLDETMDIHDSEMVDNDPRKSCSLPCDKMKDPNQWIDCNNNESTDASKSLYTQVHNSQSTQTGSFPRPNDEDSMEPAIEDTQKRSGIDISMDQGNVIASSGKGLLGSGISKKSDKASAVGSSGGQILRHYSTESGSNVLSQLRNEGVVPYISSDSKIKGKTSVLLREWREINSRKIGDQVPREEFSTESSASRNHHLPYVPAPNCRLKPITCQVKDPQYLNTAEDVLDTIDWDLNKTDADFLTLRQGRHLAYMEKQINSSSGENDIHAADKGEKTERPAAPRASLKFTPGKFSDNVQTRELDLARVDGTLTKEEKDHLKQLQDSIDRISHIEKMVLDMDLL